MIAFMIQAFVISLSGVMAPGPVTASALGMGVRNRFAGAMMGLGHCLIEFPLVVVLLLGVGVFFESEAAQMWIGLLGGAFIIFMAVQMLLDLKKVDKERKAPKTERPFIAGIVLSAANPYFILWWIAIGLNIANEAKNSGILALVIFAVIHWSCDIIWLQILSWSSFKGTQLFGVRGQKILLGVCASALAVFGVRFIFNAGKLFFG